ncbi:hypothetical protein OG866_14160 [Streptomyces sp. NBC_00663]|uniref:hypothetical protein n=1 Tax=Streptomyces sp. NBC_00663 TaxID=2975801 RepID=UPI002E3296D5|nr:hypothetical protein [Streptomyces sp. NBC_00663]
MAEGAREQVKGVAGRLDLGVRVVAAERVRGGGDERLPMWRTVGHSPEVAATASGASWRAWGSRLGGLRRRVWAVDEAEALRLARRPLPGGELAPAGVKVRSAVPEADGAGVLPRDIGPVLVAWVALLGVAYGVVAAHSGLRGGNALQVTVGPVAVALGCAGARWAIRRLWLTRDFAWTLLGGAGTTSLLCLLALGLGLGLGGRADDGGAELFADLAHTLWILMTGLLPAVLLSGGLFLLFYSSGWRSLTPWLLPFVIPVALGLLPGAGGLVVRQYLDAFGTEPAAVGVSWYWQLRATASWMPRLALVLVVPSALGYLRALHQPVRTRAMMVASGIVAAFLVYTSLTNHLLDPARAAGRDAVSAASHWRTPSPFYGIEPTWVCAAPLAGKTVGDVPVVGGVFSAERAYLMLGDSEGTVVFWAPLGEGAAETLEMPLDALRIRGVRRPWAGCGRP